VELVQRPDKPQPLSYENVVDDMEGRQDHPRCDRGCGNSELEDGQWCGRCGAPGAHGWSAEVTRRSADAHSTGRYFDAADMDDAQQSLPDHHTTRRSGFSDRRIRSANRMRFGRADVHGNRRLPGARRDLRGFPNIQENSVIIPFTLMKYLHRPGVVRLLDVQARGRNDVPSVERQVGQLLRSRHPTEAEYKVQSLTAILGAAKEYLAGADHRAYRDCVHCVVSAESGS